MQVGPARPGPARRGEAREIGLKADRPGTRQYATKEKSVGGLARGVSRVKAVSHCRLAVALALALALAVGVAPITLERCRCGWRWRSQPSNAPGYVNFR